MNTREWQAIEQAAQVLGLGDSATLAEIKKAYHRLSKLHHPDIINKSDGVQMYQIIAAYEALSLYCREYRFPLRRASAEEQELDIHNPEDWWQARFGQDPIWSGKKTRKR